MKSPRPALLVLEQISKPQYPAWMMIEDLLREIDAFQKRTGLSGRALGTRATGDAGLISRIRAGRHITMQTGQRLQKFMRGYRESDTGGKRKPRP